MASITLAIEGSRVGSYRFTRQIPTEDTARILAAYAAALGPIVEEVDGVPTPRPRTPQEIVDGLAEGFLQGVLANVYAHERAAALAAAEASVRPIQPQP